LGRLYRQLARGRPEFLLRLDVVGALPVRPGPEPEEQAAGDQPPQQCREREPDVSKLDHLRLEPGHGGIEKAKRVERRHRDKDIAAEKPQERIREDVAREGPRGEEKEQPLAEGDDGARAEERPRDRLARCGETIGEKRQEKRQQPQRETAGRDDYTP